MEYNKYQEAHQQWLDKYNEKRERTRKVLESRNARRFKQFQNLKGYDLNSDKSYKITNYLDQI